MLVIGSGGVLVELMQDVSVHLLPVSRAEVLEALSGLKLMRMLEGYRGAPPADVEALADAIVAIADVYLDKRGELADLEVNPVVVRTKGQGVCAVDVRAIWNEGPG
jgi:acyl-CoA synthetase (NDP forming)